MRYRVIISGGIALIVLVGVLALVFGRKGGGNELKGTLEFWSFEEPAVWKEIIDAFEAQHEKIDVVYRQKSFGNYEQELINALAAGAGPDLFAIHHLWLAKHVDKLAPFPTELLSTESFRATFVDVATKDLVRNNAVFALPFYIDTLALYYNKDIFNSAGVALAPKTWEDFNKAVETTARRDEAGTILRAGAGIGTAANVSYASDILSALMLQTGTVMIDIKNGEAIFDKQFRLENELFSPGVSALEYYTSFADPLNPVYTWNLRAPNDLKAFLEGSSAMYLGYAGDLKKIEESQINFGLAPFPQAKDSLEDPNYINLYYARYWAGGVNRLSTNRTAAWTFLAAATSRNTLFNYLSKAKLPTSRRDLIDIQMREPGLRVFASQVLAADSWLQPDHTQVKTIFNQMIEDVVLGRASTQEAIQKAARAVTNIGAQ